VRQGAITAASVLVLATALAVCGCGGSSAHRRGSNASERTIEYLGGRYTLASDRVPEGAAFSILGQRYRFWRRDYIELTVHYAKPGQVEEGGSGWQGGEVLEWGTQRGCQRRPFAIFDGILKSPQDEVFLSAGGKLVAMRKAQLPAGLRYHGALVYGVAPMSSYSVLIRTLSGKIIDEASGIRFAESSEVCRGTPSARRAAALRRSRLRPLLAAVAGCMRRKGFDVTIPTARRGRLETHGLDTSSPAFLAARRSCLMAEIHEFARRPGSAGPLIKG
jgi:hypothetical protein